MATTVRSTALIGVDAVRVDSEADVIGGKERFHIVGLPDTALREARDRVRCAIINSGIAFPNSDVIVSLGPAALPKSGSRFDLAIALSVLAAADKVSTDHLSQIVCVGELSLDGRVKGVPGAIASACHARKEGLTLLISHENWEETQIVQTASVVPIRTLLDAIAYLNSSGQISPNPPESNPKPKGSPGADFGDVIGQEVPKRALEIAASGGHNILFVGPPGAGKSMLAARLPSILPPLVDEEIIEVSKVHSACGLFGETPIRRPFRAPHHTASTAGMVGGGGIAIQPGEISLAHRGILFLDEFPEFRRETLEALRQPLETRTVSISRAALRVHYPAEFQLIAAMNPCPCGKWGAAELSCECTPMIRRRYLSKLSAPLLDRIDLQLWINPVKGVEFTQPLPENPTPKMASRVICARDIQTKRFGERPRLNSSLSPKELKRHCPLNGDGTRLLEKAVDRLKLSARAYHRILRVGRTIADLESAATIEAHHLAEALSYRLTMTV